MNKNKILIELEIPIIEKKYDLFIPINKKVGTIKKLLEDALVELSDNSKLVMEIDNTLAKGSASFKKGILSNEKIKKELNWYPKYNVKEGFKRTIEYLKDVK